MDEQGIAIGNGLTDPGIQYKAYPDFALDMKLIEQSDYNSINELVPPCEQATKLCGNSSQIIKFICSFCIWFRLITKKMILEHGLYKKIYFLALSTTLLLYKYDTRHFFFSC